jgi:hypothetical protein
MYAVRKSSSSQTMVKIQDHRTKVENKRVRHFVDLRSGELSFSGPSRIRTYDQSGEANDQPAIFGTLPVISSRTARASFPAYGSPEETADQLLPHVSD